MVESFSGLPLVQMEGAVVEAYMAYEIRLVGKATVFQAAQDVLSRCDMVRCKHSPWQSLWVDVCLSETNKDSEIRNASVSVGFRSQAEYANLVSHKRVPGIIKRSAWWEDIAAILSPPRSGSIDWVVVSADQELSPKITDTFAALDNELRGS